MQISVAALILALTSTIVATPISPLNGVNNACYYKRDIDAYVRRDASNAEILCGKQQQQIQNRDKRHHSAQNLVDESTSEKRHHVAQNKVNDSVNEKRHHSAEAKLNDESATYKRHHASESEIIDITKRVPPPSSNNACYYKRDLETGNLIALKRDASNAEIQCGSA